MKDTVTPIRQQYLRIKRKYPNAIVLFRLGDFYETFDEDARIVPRELEIVLTSREMGKGNRVPMAGIPYHALDNYLARLVNHGHKVAICEQMTKPGATRGIVEREVTRVVTPGTVVEPAWMTFPSSLRPPKGLRWSTSKLLLSMATAAPGCPWQSERPAPSFNTYTRTRKE